MLSLTANQEREFIFGVLKENITPLPTAKFSATLVLLTKCGPYKVDEADLKTPD